MGGTGKQFYNPPSEYSPPVQKFGFIGEDLKCQKCGTRFGLQDNLSTIESIFPFPEDTLCASLMCSLNPSSDDLFSPHWLQSKMRCFSRLCSFISSSTFVSNGHRGLSHLLAGSPVDDEGNDSDGGCDGDLSLTSTLPAIFCPHTPSFSWNPSHLLLASLLLIS